MRLGDRAVLFVLAASALIGPRFSPLQAQERASADSAPPPSGDDNPPPNDTVANEADEDSTLPEALEPDLGDPDAPVERDWLHLHPRELYIGLEGEYDYRRVRSGRTRGNETTHKNRDWRIIEKVGIAFDGDVYAPELLNYQAMLEAGLAQTRFVEEIDGWRDEEDDWGYLGEYDVTINALETKPFSINAYARHYDDRIARRFLPSLREEQTEAGVSGLLTLGSTQTELGFSWRDIERMGNRLELDDEELEVSRFYVDHVWEISEDQRLKVQYEHGEEENRYQGSDFEFDTRRDELRIDHELAFGEAKKHRLDTFLRYNEEEGDLARDEFQLVPRLMLEHSDQFKTIHRYGFTRYEQDIFKLDQHKFDSTAIYTPSDHWRFTVNGFGLYERIDDALDRSEFGGGLDVDYHRPTELGEFAMNVAFAYSRARTIGDAESRLIRDETHVLGGSQPVFLRERYVVPGSIVAHNGTRTRIYVPGVDYSVSIYNGRARIRRILNGRIGIDEVVYFDYRYRIPSDGEIDTYRGDFLVEHRFDFGLTPYYGYEGRGQEVDGSRGSPFERDNQNRHRLGARFARDRYEVGAEYEIFDDSVEPYDAWHLTGNVDVFQSATHSVDFITELSRYDFEGGFDDRNVWWFNADLRDRLRLNRHLALLTAVGYRWEDDSVDGDTNAVDIECGIEFVRGDLSVDLTLEYDLLSFASESDNSFGAYLNVRRNLTSLLPKSEGR